MVLFRPFFWGAILFGCALGVAYGATFELGINFHIGQQAISASKVIDFVSFANIKNGRDEIYWSRIEIDKGKFINPPEMAELKRLATYFRSNGGRLVVVLGYGNSIYESKSHPRSDEAIDAYSAYCEYVASRFRGLGVVFEIWNEWNSEIGVPLGRGKGSPEDYIRLISKAGPAIRRGAPDALIISTGIARGVEDIDWLRSFAKLNGGKYIDGVGIHTYIFNKPSWTIARLVKLLQDISSETTPLGELARSKGFYITEYGLPFQKDDATKSSKLVEAILNLSTLEVVRGIWLYQLIDPSRGGGDEANFGLFNAEAQSKAGLYFRTRVFGLINQCGRPSRINDGFFVFSKGGCEVHPQNVSLPGY